MIAEYDVCEAWGQWECRSMAHWMVGHLGESMVTAREHVRAAHALRNNALLCESFATGHLSYARVRVVSRIITPTSEAELVELAGVMTAAQLERFARGVGRAALASQPDLGQMLFESRSLYLHPNDDGSWDLRGTLPPETGALLRRVLDDRRLDD